MGTVSQITTELIQDGWILEVGEGDYTGGRRQVMLKLNPTMGYAMGLKVMEDRVVCAVTNFEAHVLHYREQSLPANNHPNHIYTALAQMTREMIAISGLRHDQFFGVGVGLAGVIYGQKGMVWLSLVPAGQLTSWRHVPAFVLPSSGNRQRLPDVRFRLLGSGDSRSPAT